MLLILVVDQLFCAERGIIDPLVFYHKSVTSLLVEVRERHLQYVKIYCYRDFNVQFSPKAFRLP